ncbi:hypothetical protein SK803_22150 [Lentzea sp. BCCO 10_0856]|uniref:Uncharacterized protein n=1 Tax=Lentzea miocenica TaxID=3095431 RepID=A0ABU4T442_9PSEU|nr:hypothetical protein [Lentzea sp. BCCO 10_0856]MDX8032929.1 hypothetical protein [Lentzea sp. BCCO 10_0856]
MFTNWHRPLLVNTLLLFGLALVAAAGIFLDDRTLLGEPLWLKPMKFGLAFGVYSGTLSWVLSTLTRARKFGWWMGTVFAVAAFAEVGAITFQAARGTFSHFNTSTDSITLLATQIFTNGVAVLFLVQLAIVTLVLFQRDGDRALKRAVRAGLALATVGMILPVYWLATEVNQRTVVDANGQEIVMYQGHDIGESGDFRVPHFIGLHGIQVLLLVVFALRRVDERLRARLVLVAAIGYTVLLAVAIWQTSRGRSLVQLVLP